MSGNGRVLVVGDFGIDRYHIGRVRGMSAEAPIPILDQSEQLDLPGMGGNVVANLLALGVDTDILPSSRDDDQIPVKNRLMTEDGVQIARWDENDKCPPYSILPSNEVLDEYDAIVVADYGKGSITGAIVECLQESGVPLFVDTKRDPIIWLGANALLFPNKAEGTKYLSSYEQLPCVVKLGERGIGLWHDGEVLLQLPSAARFVRCVNGAGDTVLAAFVAAHLRGFDQKEVLTIANTAAGIVCEQSFRERTTNFSAIHERLYADWDVPTSPDPTVYGSARESQMELDFNRSGDGCRRGTGVGVTSPTVGDPHSHSAGGDL